jgi:hypothetical protein
MSLCGATGNMTVRLTGIVNCVKLLLSCQKTFDVLLEELHNSVKVIVAQKIGGICAVLGSYAAMSRSSVPTFRYKLLVPSTGVKKSKNISWPS